jgi:ParB family chromosome partitioning protein
MSEYQNNSIFWVETIKIQPNPFQPRREFEPGALEDLADSIRQYGILQPLVVTRKETLRPDNNGMDVSYELIAGERRLRAAKIAGLQQVPVIIRKETDNKVKLELAIIENLQREDLNPIDRALAFEQLYKEFNLTHVEIGKRMGKSRVYVSNSLRLLSLPELIKQGLMGGKISEGHTRPLLMLSDRPEEQETLYKEIMVKKMSVRDAEKVARKIAQDKVRKKEFIVDPRIRAFEKQLAENLGTRVHIEPKEKGGQITIDYFTLKDLEEILSSMKKVEREQSMMENYLQKKPASDTQVLEDTTAISFDKKTDIAKADTANTFSQKENISEKSITQYSQELPEYVHKKEIEITESRSELPEPKTEDIIENKKTGFVDLISINNNQFDTGAKDNDFIKGENNESRPESSKITDKLDIPDSQEVYKNTQQPENYSISQSQDNLKNNYPHDRFVEKKYDNNNYQSQDNYSQSNKNQQDSYPQNYYPPQQSQQIHYQQAPRKKGLFGRLFG